MKCLSQGDIQAFLDSELPGGRHDQAEAHLRRCRRCLWRLQQINLNRELFRSRAKNLVLELSGIAEGRSQAVSHWPRPWFVRRWAVPVPLLAMAAAVFVVFGMLLIGERRELQNRRTLPSAAEARTDMVISGKGFLHAATLDNDPSQVRPFPEPRIYTIKE